MALRPTNELQPLPGPTIARAWFATVINPLLARLEEERSLLAAGRYSWRQQGGFQQLAPVREYLQPGFRLNLEQVMEHSLVITRAIGQHDRVLRHLDEKLRSLFEQLREDPLVQEQAAGSLYGRLKGAGDFAALLAEAIVNNDLGEPDQDDRGVELPEIARKHAVLAAAVRVKAKELAATAELLVSELMRLRARLALRHDLPYAPVEEHHTMKTG
jgi:hypothetical protein